jgi:glycosyltransferase involved in cell wall biosynthesis
MARLAYLVRLGLEIVRHPHDLLVEDFSAPFSVGFSPLYTRKPVTAIVHWLFASNLRAKYHLPFDTVEHVGLRLYHNFIAVSGWLVEQLDTRRPGAIIEVIPNAVEELAFAVEPAEPEHLLFIGRLDIVHKGLDFLLDIAERANSILGDRMPPVLLAGDGPDQAILEHQAEQRNLSHIIKFLGRVE